nr:hypothetical protein [Tanacetum cinerariifolium]
MGCWGMNLVQWRYRDYPGDDGATVAGFGRESLLGLVGAGQAGTVVDNHNHNVNYSRITRTGQGCRVLLGVSCGGVGGVVGSGGEEQETWEMAVAGWRENGLGMNIVLNVYDRGDMFGYFT